ncbi:Ger(x)C family spore germination C-terminal domain-containing protein, partial [Yersinia pestis]|nr:Ger(x)C family spore germination C-terminal domain-containing protein [Yersinia pestis]
EINVEEKNTDTIPINNSKILQEIARENEHSVKELLIGLIQKTQKKESDIFGFGELVRAKKPAYWKSHVKSAEQWGEIYKNITFDYRVTSKVRRIGMKAE